ncbi:MAG: prevent-host-death protein [Gemmatimonadaceae bacterium]|nr:prevent-host-death protein [Gemmatimonadaceae bacterium]
MRSVGLKVLKNRLSEYVRLAAGGETVLVTDHDRVVAELRPPSGRGPSVSDAYLASAVREGIMTPPLLTRDGPPDRQPIGALEHILSGLEGDRADR